MANNKDERLRSILMSLAAEFFSRQSNRQSLITITDVEILGRGKKAIIKISVLPETMEKQALEFTQRQISDLSKYVKEHSRIARIPFFEIGLDIGEKNRQRIDAIS